MPTTFVVTGDIHWHKGNPVARTDVYPVSLERKLREVHEIAAEVGAEAILQPGDLTHSIGIGYGAVIDLIRILKDAPCPWLSIPGNHDREGGNPATDARSPFGLLCAAGVVRDVSRHFYFYDALSTPLLTVTGHGYDHETDLDKSQYGPPQSLIEFRDRKDYTFIHLAHGMLLRQPSGIEGLRHTVLSEIADLPNAPDVLICGHEHLGFGIRQVGKTLCINPGALCRLSAHIEEIERQVQVAILRINDDGRIEAELRPLQSAQPGDIVLSRDHIVEAAERQYRLNRFLDLLQEEHTGQLDLVSMVDELTSQEQLPDQVKAEALRRISEAREKLAIGA